MRVTLEFFLLFLSTNVVCFVTNHLDQTDEGSQTIFYKASFFFLAFLGKGLLSAFSNKLGKSSQMKIFFIFCKGV